MSKSKSNWTAKLFALIIAIFLWSYVMGVENPVINGTIKDVNITFTNMATLDRQGLVVMEPKSPTINVGVTGKKSDVDRLTSANILAEVDLSGYSEGDIKIPVTVKLLNAADSIKKESHEPREILFKIDKIIEKEISINIQTEGEVPEGYILEEISKKPKNISIKGPRSWVNEVSEARAVIDSISDMTSSSNVSLPVKLLNDKGEEVRGIDKDPSIVDVTIDISKTMSLPIKLETTNELPENISIKDIKIYPNTVMIKGSGDLLDIKEIKTKAIDINSLIGDTSMDIELALPEGIKLVDESQKISISYNVEEIVEKEYVFSESEISIRNLDENIEVSKESMPQETKIILKGSKTIFDNISKDNLKIFIDLKDKGLGVHEIEIKLEDIQGLELKSIDPVSIDIELTQAGVTEEPLENESDNQDPIDETDESEEPEEP